MGSLDNKAPNYARATVERFRQTAEQRLASNPPCVCPVDMARNFLTLCHAQTCGKCSPCRIGIGQLVNLLDKVLDGDADLSIIDTIEETAQVVADAADCAIGAEAAKKFLIGLKESRQDYEEHIIRHRCLDRVDAPIPCIALCPAHVDVPGYIALVHEGRCTDAVRLIRRDNPFPSVCGFVCEHPCEKRCRRGMVDAPLNIRSIKRYAVDHSSNVPQPPCAPSTGKRVAVVGAGPGGLTTAYYLALMGHDITVYEKRKQLGGMLRYGIPDYRLPRDLLDAEIHSMLQLGIKTRMNVDVGFDVLYEQLRQEYDAVFISLGAHADKKLGIEGEDAVGVMSAVQILREVGDGKKPDFTGKRVVVVGGGNVAMDATRSSIRFGAHKVICAYRRRREDMPALVEEIEGAIAEGAEILPLHAPVRVEKGENGEVTALWVQPQIIGPHDTAGRPRPLNADLPERRLPADVVIVAIGQGIETEGLQKGNFQLDKRGTIVIDSEMRVVGMDGIFAGGECVTGPATVIKAITAGKAAASSIDRYLGFHHKISVDVKLPVPQLYDIHGLGRVNTLERDADERKHDYECITLGMSDQEARYETSRCLRCDHFGYGVFRGGRKEEW